MSPKDIVVLVNERAAEDADFLSLLGSEFKVINLDGADAAERLAGEAATAGCRAVVACGGDGTINDVINGVLNQKKACPVGVIPFGTANDFATAAGIECLSREEQIKLIVEGTATPIDIGRMNDRYFVNAASIGFGAEVTAETPSVLKHLLGGVAYSLTGAVKAFMRAEKRAQLSGPFEWEGDLLLLMVANSRFAGGGYRVGPDAVVNDGKLDITVIPDVLHISELPEVLTALTESLLGDDSVTLSSAIKAQASALHVRPDGELAINLDGQPTTATELKFDVIPEGLQVFLPVGSPILIRPTTP